MGDIPDGQDRATSALSRSLGSDYSPSASTRPQQGHEATPKVPDRPHSWATHEFEKKNICRIIRNMLKKARSDDLANLGCEIFLTVRNLFERDLSKARFQDLGVFSWNTNGNMV